MQGHWPGCSWRVCPVSLCLPRLGLWNLHREQAPNLLKSNVWDQPLLLQLLRAASCPTDPQQSIQPFSPAKSKELSQIQLFLLFQQQQQTEKQRGKKNPNL